MTSSKIATIFLDRELNIRRFTPAITTIFNVLEQDIGRPIGHISSNLESSTVFDEARCVLENETTIENEVQSKNAVPFLQRITPYRSASGEVDGVVMTFTEISAVAQFAKKVRQYQLGMEELQDFVYRVSHELQEPMRAIAGYMSRAMSSIPPGGCPGQCGQSKCEPREDAIHAQWIAGVFPQHDAGPAAQPC